MTVCVFISVYRRENIDYIPLAYCTLDSLDIVNLILTVLRPYLTGVLFDLILKFRAALSLYHFLLSLSAFSLSSLLSLLSVQLVCTLMCVGASLCVSV